MYIIELFEHFLKKIRSNKETFNEEEKEPEKCNHMFVPLDSTGEVLACNKCGITVHKKELLKKNFFSGK